MAHCPYCGTPVKEKELFCIKCGNELPADLYERTHFRKRFNRFWLFPIMAIALFLIFSSMYYFILQNMDTQAEKLYKQGEEQLLDGDFLTAEERFQEAVAYKEHFHQAKTAHDFTKIAIKNENHMEQAEQQLHDDDFTEALNLMKEAESDLNTYNGEAVTTLVNKIENKRSEIKTAQLKNDLEDDPSTDALKSLLWEADSIKSEKAEQMTEEIREQIVNDSYAKASEHLRDKQFSDAKTHIQDGLQYAPDSEKLDSLKTTIEKEKEAFESTQEKRFEQAQSTAEEEEELNESDAVELSTVSVEESGEDKMEVNGEVESVATVPVNSISIEYELITKDDEEEILTNDVYVFPDTLYPDEKGEFEFTHEDVDEEEKIDIEVKKIKWYTE